MPEATAATTQTTNEAPAELSGSVEERADAIFGPAVFDDGSDGDETAEAGATEAPAAAPAPPAESPVEDANAKARAERRAKLAELNAKTRANVDSRAAQREAEQLRQQLAEANARLASRVDPNELDALQIIELGMKRREPIPPAQMAEAIKKAGGSPELVAQMAARQAVDPVVAKLASELQAARADIEAFKQSQQSARAQAEEDAAHQSFAAYTQQNVSTSPLAARFLEQHGPAEFRRLTEGATQDLPPGVGAQAVLDEIEDRLTALGKIYAAPAAPQRTQANPTRPLGTATQAPTHVTNSLAQTRSSVVDEEAALQDMPYEERASFIFRRH
jgi:hypothetical protein